MRYKDQKTTIFSELANIMETDQFAMYDLLDVIIESVSDVDTELCRKLKLVKGLVEDGKPYKKILREKYGYVA